MPGRPVELSYCGSGFRVRFLSAFHTSLESCFLGYANICIYIYTCTYLSE